MSDLKQRYTGKYCEEFEHYYPFDKQLGAMLSLDETVNLLNKQNQRIAELERERERRDLEQQVKGIMRVMACRELNLSEGEIDTLILMKEQLRKGAGGG